MALAPNTNYSFSSMNFYCPLNSQLSDHKLDIDIVSLCCQWKILQVNAPL